MAYRSEIERALNEMMSDETGMKFQGLAVLHGEKKWPQLVACERKWDRGLDAHAKRVLQRDGKGIGLASSITATIKKISNDAKEVKLHYADVQVLTSHRARGSLSLASGYKTRWSTSLARMFSVFCFSGCSTV
jgi:hypothetical protein